MKIGIYNEPSQGGIGGCEYSVAILAEALSREHFVEIIHHKTYLERTTLAAFSGTELNNVKLRYVEPEPFSHGSSHLPWKRYRESKAWHANLSEPYDLFIAFVHGYPPFSSAPKSALIVLFPFNELPRAAHPIKNVYKDWEWAQRFATYDSRIAISQFTRLWTQRRWGIDCEVIYPPVDTHFTSGYKSNSIISIGRFTVSGHSKKQLEMISAFEQMKSAWLNGWDYFQIGSRGDSQEDLEFFEKVRRAAATCEVKIFADVTRSELKSVCSRSKIFWHAAGLHEGDSRPELAEHFGIATVEAMSAGCVPVVINHGAQPEIVEHEVSGFIWNEIDELIKYTRLLANDERLREQMSRAALTRAQDFSKEVFLSRISNHLFPFASASKAGSMS